MTRKALGLTGRWFCAFASFLPADGHDENFIVVLGGQPAVPNMGGLP
ncbi:MAG: hypothetical protein WC508_03970 [Patescibacteria group bacterium]